MIKQNKKNLRLSIKILFQNKSKENMKGKAAVWET